MRNYIIRRLLQMIPLILGISFLVFIILSLTGDPFAALMENPRVKIEDIRRLQHQWGFDLPVYLRYFKWLFSIFKGDWGPSLLYPGRMSYDIVMSRIPVTLQVMGISFLVALIVAIPIGIYSAVHQYSFVDYLVTSLSFFGMSMPTFWFGLMLMILFSLVIQINGQPLLPPGGIITPGMASAPFWVRFVDRLKYLVMPVIVLAFNSMGPWSRYMRSSMLEVVRQDYIRTARAKGLSERVVIYKHALRNALIPIVTLVALSIPGIVSGASITEFVFNIPGMGQLTLNAITKNDFPTAMVCLLLIGFLTIFFNLIADIVYAIVDPRIRYT